MIELTTVTTLLQRVFTNREQSDRLNRFLRSRYGPQLSMISSPTVNYLVRRDIVLFIKNLFSLRFTKRS